MMTENDETKLAFFDLDGTFYRWSLFLDLIKLMVQEGLLPENFLAKAEPAREKWKAREGSYGDYLKVVVELVDAGGLKGIPVARAQELAAKLVQTRRRNAYLFTRLLFQAAKELKYVTVAISHSPDVIVRAMASAWGFDHAYGIELGVENGLLTGGHTKRRKDEFVKAIAQELCGDLFTSTLMRSVAVGDSMGDVPMFNAVKYPVVYNPERELREMARRSDWPVVTERKDSIMAFKCAKIGQARGRYFAEVPLNDFLPADLAMRFTERLASYGHTF
jgi:HAD superfamily phosphoserine phosphatase-like hydrolase